MWPTTSSDFIAVLIDISCGRAFDGALVAYLKTSGSDLELQEMLVASDASSGAGSSIRRLMFAFTSRGLWNPTSFGR
jgi:hypothetical protein